MQDPEGIWKLGHLAVAVKTQGFRGEKFEQPYLIVHYGPIYINFLLLL